MTETEIETSGGRAYLIEAVDKDSALKFADERFLHLFCEKKTGCGECAGCRGFLERKLPGCLLLRGGGKAKDEKTKDGEVNDEKQKGKSVTELFRNKITGFASQSLSGKSFRAVIITDADRLHINAQNAILKILEEPPPRLIFVLTTSKKRNLLPTILSRCIILKAKNCTEDDAVNKLSKEFKLPEDKARILLNSAYKDFNRAKWLAGTDADKKAKKDYFAVRDDAIEALNILWNARGFATSKMEHLILHDQIDEKEKDEKRLKEKDEKKKDKRKAKLKPDQVEKNLEIALIYIQDVINYKFGIKEIANADRIEDIRRHSHINDLKLTVTADKIAEFIQKAELCKGLNVKLGITSMLFDILEDIV